MVRDSFAQPNWEKFGSLAKLFTYMGDVDGLVVGGIYIPSFPKLIVWSWIPDRDQPPHEAGICFFEFSS